MPSTTTLLGLVKHATFVEGVWFDQAVTGQSYAEIGIAGTVDGSFALRKGDTIATVQAAYRKRSQTSRSNLAILRSDDIVNGARCTPGLGASAASPPRACATHRPRRDPP